MKTTSIFCIHPSVNDIPSFLQFTCMKDHFPEDSLRWDNCSPDVLFVTEQAFYRKRLFTEFKSLYGKSGIKVAWMGEAVSPDMNIFDYGIGFDSSRESDERFIRILSPLDMFHRFIRSRNNEIRDELAAGALLHAKERFCNFLYSNPCAHPMRDGLFHALEQYSKVDSLGRHLNNVGAPGTGWSGHAHECVGLKEPYRFSIAAENACYEGYTSEKIFTSLLAHTVPIYWGNPSIDMDVNPECFINASKFPDMDALVAYVREVDGDRDLWKSYVSREWLTKEQEEYHVQRSRKYRSGMEALLSGGRGRMTPEGYHVEMYRKQFFKDGFALDRSVLSGLF